MKRALVAVVLTSACVVAPTDPFPAAQRACERGDLLRAMALLEQIAPVHPNHPEAVRLAIDVRARIEASQREVVVALQARSLGRSDLEANALSRARELWPAVFVPTLPLPLFAETPAVVPAVPAAEPAHGNPVPPATARAADALRDLPPAPRTLAQAATPPPDEARGLDPEVGSEGLVAVAVTDELPNEIPAVAPAPTARPADAPVPDLPTLRVLVHACDPARAIQQLGEAHAADPGNVEIRQLLARVLHQRALVAYGRGWLESAADDWARVARLLPEDRTAAARLLEVTSELARKRDRGERRKNAGG